MNSLFRHLVVFTLAIILAFPFYAEAQHPEFVSAPSEIKSKYEQRKQMIVQELENLKANNWAGIYWAQTGLIDGALLYWSPVNGFVVRSGNDFHRGIERINYGKAGFSETLLTFFPEYHERGRHIYPVADRFVPVKWDQQHWLIPLNEMMLFIYAVNSEDYEEISTFFLKDEDSKKESKGLPQVPPEYRKYLRNKPIKTKVIKIDNINERYNDYTFTLNAGKVKGVIEGMKLYLVNVKNIEVKIEITNVAERTSTGRAISIGRTGDYEKEIKPLIGWTFTSKLPRLF